MFHGNPMKSPHFGSRRLTQISWDMLKKDSMTSLVVQFWVEVTTAQGQKMCARTMATTPSIDGQGHSESSGQAWTRKPNNSMTLCLYTLDRGYQCTRTIYVP